jgi:hypothetical protein
MGSDLHSDVSDVVLPVTSVKVRSRRFMPTGRFHCVRSPERKSIERRGMRKVGKERKKENEE